MRDHPHRALYPWLQPLLLLICTWGGVEAVLAWWRQPAPPPVLPTRLQFQDRWYERESKPPALHPLPPGVDVKRAADYRAPGAPRLAFRWLVTDSSGSGVRLEPEKLSPLLFGPGHLGSCRVYDPNTGVLLGVAKDGAGVRRLLASTDPQGLQRLEWALGLRPWRQNRCLLVGILP